MGRAAWSRAGEAVFSTNPGWPAFDVLAGTTIVIQCRSGAQGQDGPARRAGGYSMSRWLQRIRVGALALSLAGMLANCGGGGDDGDGGGNSLRLFFGINGEGSCNSVVVSVDLADADAILERKVDGTVDCTLDTFLAGKGCHATYTELDGGDRLRVTISGCAIPAVTNLFVCGFQQVDISDLVTESSAQCTCAVPGCDNTPPLCIDEDADPRSCEDCENGRDDDANGLVDCDDPNCEHAPPCVDSTTSTTTTTIADTITTTTTEIVTTTTLPVQPILINFLLTSSRAPVATLRFTVNYTSAPGQFEGSGEAVACTNKVDGATFTRDNKASIRKLSLGWVPESGFSAPTGLASCRFIPGTPVPVPANFTVVINEATDADGGPMKVDIAVTVTQAP